MSESLERLSERLLERLSITEPSESEFCQSDSDLLSQAADLDRWAWQAICRWPEHCSIEVVRDRLDYGALTRYFLWDKVPRAIRSQVDPEGFAFEQSLLERYPSALQSAVEPSASGGALYRSFSGKRLKQFLKRQARIASLRLRHWKKTTVFVPRVHPQLHSTITALQDRPNIRLVAPFDPGNTLLDTFVAAAVGPADEAFARQLYNGILQGLLAFEIELLESDRTTLAQQILAQSRLIPQVEAELAAMKPQAVLVFADNHTPSQEYVAIANRQGIPTVLLQHGLDCEQHCLDEAYASVIAVWGKARKQRYQTDSLQSLSQIEVTGNPRYDSVSVPSDWSVDLSADLSNRQPGSQSDSLRSDGNRWLWVTRPHSPYKCYSPSRLPSEGLDILEALLMALEQNKTAELMIKPHPFDYADLYAEKIEAWGLGDRVTISQASLQSLFPEADIVISEDSTAAMEAMFYSKVLIHAHFAASAAVLPLVDYAAALPAHNAKMLQTSLGLAARLSTEDRENMLAGQRNFVQDYAGLLDGKAAWRVTSLIEQVISSNK